MYMYTILHDHISPRDKERQRKQPHLGHFFPKKKLPQVGSEPTTLCTHVHDFGTPTHKNLLHLFPFIRPPFVTYQCLNEGMLSIYEYQVAV